MLTRNAVGASLCLTCYRHILVRVPQSYRQWSNPSSSTWFICLPPTVRPAHRRFITTTSGKHGDSDERAVPVDKSTAITDDVPAVDLEEPYIKIPARTYKIKNRYWKDGRQGKKRVKDEKKRRTIKEDKVELAMKSLGRKSEVLILRDAEVYEHEDDQVLIESHGGTVGDGKTAEETVHNEAISDTSERKDTAIEAMVDQDSKVLHGPTLIRAIDDMRLPAGVPVNLELFEAKAKELARSFTTLQLLNYLNVKTEHSKEETKTNNPPMWQPYRTSMPGTDHPRTELRGKKKKRAIIQRVISEIWDVVSDWDLHANGTLVFSVKPWDIDLLCAGSPHSELARIAKLRQVRLSVAKDAKVILVIGDRNSCEAAATDIKNALDTAFKVELQWPDTAASDRTKFVLGSELHSKLLSLFKRLGDGYKVILRLNESTLLIKGFDEASVLFAKRALTAALWNRMQSSPAELYLENDTKWRAWWKDISTSEHVLDLDDGRYHRYRLVAEKLRGVSHMEVEPQKVQSQPRKAAASSESFLPVDSDNSSKVPEQIVTIDKKGQHALTKFLHPTSRDGDSADPEPLSSTYETYEMTASTGYSLSPASPDHIIKTQAFTVLQKFVARSRNSHWISVVPGLRRVLTHISRHDPDCKLLNSSADHIRQSPSMEFEGKAVVFTYVPHIWTTEDSAVHRFPALEVEFSTPLQDAQPQIERLSFVLFSSTRHVLLPSSSTDVRFNKRKLYSIPLESLPDLSQLSDLVDQIVGSAAKQGTIRAPEIVKLPINAWLKKWYSEREDESMKDKDVEYYLLSSQSHETTQGFFRGHRATYTISDSSTFYSGRQSQLQLHLDQPRLQAGTSERDVRSFIDATLELNSIVDEAAKGRLRILSVQEKGVSALAMEELQELGDESGGFLTGSMRVKEVLAESRNLDDQMQGESEKEYDMVGKDENGTENELCTEEDKERQMSEWS